MDEGYCKAYHAHLGIHVEEAHQHCDILKTNAPVYEGPELLTLKEITAVVVSEIRSIYRSQFFAQHTGILPARAPPLSA